jgi:hypothetical protein
MKKLIIAIIVAVSFQVVNAQVNPVDQNRQVIEFLKDRCLTFNRGQVPVRVDDLSKVTDSLQAKRINYSRTIYIFDGEQITDETVRGGSSEATTGKKAVPFIKYRVYTEGRLTYLEVIDGNSYV